MPCIINSGNARLTNHIRPILIIKPKSPKVKILKGKAIIFITGFIKKFNSPKKAPAIIKYLISPVNSTPDTNFIASQKLRTPPATWKIKLNIIL